MEFLSLLTKVSWKIEIELLSDCNWTRTHNHLVRKRTLNHLAKLIKWLSCVVSTYLYGIYIYELSGCGFESGCSHFKLQISRLFQARNSLTFRQMWSVDSLWSAYVTWKEHTVELLSICLFLSNRIFLVKALFLHDQKVKTKIQISWEWKKLKRWNKKHFLSFFKNFQLPTIVSELRVPL